MKILCYILSCFQAALQAALMCWFHFMFGYNTGLMLLVCLESKTNELDVIIMWSCL